MLEFKNVTYIKDEKIILDNVSFKINDNDLLVITGPNGSGKSTIAKLIMGIIKPSQGSIIFNNTNIDDISITGRANMGITFTFQTPVVFKGLKVNDLLRIAGKGRVSFDDAKEYLSMTGLCAKDYLNRYVDKTLSGGEQKRIEIAVSLAKGSLLRIFDEPEAGIDLWSFDELVNIFRTIKKEKLGSSIIISHQERILKIADKIMILEKGKVKEFGNKKDILPLIKHKPCEFCKENE